MKYCFGVDIGGTMIKMGLFGENGELLNKWEIKTKTVAKGETILPSIASEIELKMKEYHIQNEDVIGIGVGVPASVSGDGFVENTTNIGWENKNVKQEIETMTGFPTIVENDANMAVLGEMWKGSGCGYQNLVMVTLGTGVGGGIVLNGQLISGTKGGAGEIGDILVDYEQTADGERIFRNLEYYASATGIVRMAKTILEANKKETALNLENVTAKDVFDLAKSGDTVAMEIVERFGFYLGWALTNLAVILEPEVFLIGGGVSQAGDILAETVRKHYYTSNSRCMLATLGNDAGIYGAAYCVLHRC